MKDYRHFETADFILDPDFIRWVQEKKPADNLFWDKFLTLHPEKIPTIDEARKILEAIDIRPSPLSDEAIRSEIGQLMQTIGFAIPAPAPTPRRIPMRLKIAVAAAVLFLILTLPFLRSSKKPTPKRFDYIAQTSSRHLIEKINSSQQRDSLIFSDGSKIWIAPNSRISYSVGLDTAAIREVYLSGEAFFEVAKNPRHPFRVIAGEVITKVLGTSFSVRSFEKDTTIQVTVRSGKVSVFSQATPGGNATTRSGNSGVILTCNQRLVYEKTARKFQKTLLDQPAIVTTGMTDDNMIYEDTPLDQVFAQLSKAYGIGIVYDNELLKKCTVSADLKGETFYRKLDLICRAIGGGYEVIDGQVVIQSAGCQ
jgi:ferric-dicitrate binding protein FerR (iron transport regulator)